MNRSTSTPLTKAGSLLILIIFALESIFIIPLIWTIPAFRNIAKIFEGTANDNRKVFVAVLGIIFGLALGIFGGILILVDMALFPKNNPTPSKDEPKEYETEYTSS